MWLMGNIFSGGICSRPILGEKDWGGDLSSGTGKNPDILYF